MRIEIRKRVKKGGIKRKTERERRGWERKRIRYEQKLQIQIRTVKKQDLTW